MNIEQLKQLNEGVEVKGFPLLIKTARNAYEDSDKQCWQDVVFMDFSGEMIGQIATESLAHRLQSKTNICVMEGFIQNTDHHGRNQNKLVVLDYFDTATPLTYDQKGDLSAEKWQASHESEIRSKIRCWLVAGCLQGDWKNFNLEDNKEFINKCVEFVMTGE